MATYPAIVRMLDDVTRKETLFDVVSKANGLFIQSKSFELVPMIVVLDSMPQQTSFLIRLSKEMPSIHNYGLQLCQEPKITKK